MEVRPDKAVAELYGRWQYSSSPLQHDPHPEVHGLWVAGGQGDVWPWHGGRRARSKQAADISQGGPFKTLIRF